MLSNSTFQIVSVADIPKDDLRVAGRTPVVLVVDDEKIIADTLSIILNRDGFSTVTAYDGLSALNLAKEVRPQLVITDVVMPGMTGVELAIAVAEIIPDCKVLLFSGQAATADLLHEAREAGHNFTTLAKPIHPADLLRQVKAHLQEDESPEIQPALSAVGFD